MKLRRYRNWPILWKILSIPLISLVLIVAGTNLVILPRIESWLLEQEKLKVKSVVEVAYQEIVQGEQAVTEGRLTQEEARKEVIRRIRELRYSGSEYFWINDLTPRMVMHPTKPELDGSDLTDNKDPRGKYLFREFVKVCLDQGEGFVDYMWPKPGEREPSPKISFVRLHKPWGWIIGSGLYIDTFQQRILSLRIFALGAAVVFSGALLILGWSVARGIKRSLDEGCAFAAAVAAGDLTRTMEITRSDEVGALASSLNGMVGALRGMMARVGDSVGQLSKASASIAMASDSMVRSAERQAADVVETSEASQEIHTLVGQVTQGVENLSTTAAESSSSVMELAASIEEVALVFDQTASGTLFLADVELARSPVGSQETLSEPPSPELIAAAEAGDVEAMRQLANLTRPHSPEPELLDLNSLVQSTCSFISFDRRFRGIEFEYALDHALPAVTVVADHVTQILMNLLINAADAMEETPKDGQARIRVSTQLADGEIRLAVADTGHGMTAAVMARAFEESFSTKPAGRGRGIGLFLCKSLVEQAGGSIELASTPGAGTTVNLRLPLGTIPEARP